MNTYCSSAGRVLVILVPVVRRGGAAEGPLPPVQIEAAPAQTATSDVA